MTLERIDRFKGYESGNCRWATWQDQADNRDHGGYKNRKPGSLRQLAISAGQPYHRVYQRVNKFGWTIEAALNTPAI